MMNTELYNETGVVTTLAGSGTTAAYKDGSGVSASFYRPYGIAVDSNNNLYISDANNRIRKITSSGES